MVERKWQYQTIEEFFGKVGNIRDRLVEITDRYLELDMDNDMTFVLSDLHFAIMFTKERLNPNKALWFLGKAIKRFDVVMARYPSFYWLFKSHLDNLEFIKDDFKNRKE
jgi:hypothetical protein